MDMLAESLMNLRWFTEDIALAKKIMLEGCCWEFVMQITYELQTHRLELLTRKR